MRDWQKDMAICHHSKVDKLSNGLSFLTILSDIGIHWLQQYKELQESYRKLHNLHEEQCARASQYYNEMVAEKERADRLKERHESFMNAVQEATEYLTWRNEVNSKEKAIKIIYEWLANNPLEKEEPNHD